jgi:Tfp pilus assembly protein PilW
MKTKKGQQGLSLMEALVAMLVASIVLAAGATLVTKALQITDLVTVRSEMQQDGRAAINSILKDLSLSGTGMPVGGVQLPTGTKSTASLYACSGGVCFLKNHNFPGNHMYPVLPDPNDGNVQQGTPDAMTMVYIDRTLNLGTASSITPSGSQIDLASVAGINIGDLIILSNVHGSAIGMVTNVLTNSNSILFASSDPLNINQPSAANGNIAGLQDPGTNKYPTTTAARILVISYYLQQSGGPDGTFGNDDDNWQLMRQVNGQQPVPVMDGVENLQVTYDVYDDTVGNASTTLLTNSKTANNTPGLIRKVNVVMSVRSSRKAGPTKSLIHLTLAAAVSPRNLSFRDRYK